MIVEYGPPGGMVERDALRVVAAKLAGEKVTFVAYSEGHAEAVAKRVAEILEEVDA